MGVLTKSRAKLYLDGLLKVKRQHINASELAQSIGIVEDFIREELSTFDPMIRLDLEFNLIELIPALEAFLGLNVGRKVKPKRKVEAEGYANIADFVYKNMTMSGGIIDRGVELNTHQLKDLKKMVNEAIKHQRMKTKERK